MKLKKMTLNINGAERMFICDPEKDTVASVLRRLGLTGVKVGCGAGVCGSCSVILNGKVTRSCTKKIKSVEEYSTVTTIEGIGTPNYKHPLQEAFIACGAVQCGFCSPGFIVSAYALLQENANPTREDIRDWFQKNRNVCRCTGYRQIVDAVMEAASVMRGEKTIKDITYTPTDDGNYYGKPIPRPSAIGKVCGVTDFGDDIALKMPDGTLQVVLVQPKLAHHAKIANLDYSEAEKMPGVVKVITHKDVIGSNRLTLFQFTPRCTALEPNHVLLAEDKIYNYGDVVALVAADTLEHARAAAAKVKVEIQPLPEYLNYLEAAMPDAVRIHDDTPNIYGVQPMFKGEEDIDKLFEEDPYVAEASFYSQREPHMSIEGDTVQAYWDEDGFLTVHCKTLALYCTLTDIAEATGIPAEKVRVVENPTGGSFGWALGTATFTLAALATVATNRPVALTMTYDEFMSYSGKRCPSYHNTKMSCSIDGKISAVEFEIGMDHGAYEELGGEIVQVCPTFMFFPYNVPNVRGICRIANTNHSYGTAYRGYGSPQAYTASEAMMDIMAEKIGMDPFDFRYKNIARPGELNVLSRPHSVYPMEEMMDKMRPYYEKAKADAKYFDRPGKRRGVGVAWGGFMVTNGNVDECTVYLELNPDNSITKYDTWEDQGQGGDVGSLMVTLEALKPLGVTPSDIHLIQNDSKFCPDSGPAATSRSHFMNGRASIIAADKLLNAMRKQDGSFRTYDEMIVEGIPTKYEGKYEGVTNEKLEPVDPNTGQGNPCPTLSYAFFMAEVEVDIETGKTTVIRFVCVDDPGKIGNIAALDGQAYGGISHSIGFALSENYEDVKRHTNMFAAGIPSIKGIPDDIVLIHNCTERESGPFGSSGASEMYQSGDHMAVINAIKDACGVRIYELPATPEKVKAGLEILANGGKIKPPKRYFLGADLQEELAFIKANPI